MTNWMFVKIKIPYELSRGWLDSFMYILILDFEISNVRFFYRKMWEIFPTLAVSISLLSVKWRILNGIRDLYASMIWEADIAIATI